MSVKAALIQKFERLAKDPKTYKSWARQNMDSIQDDDFYDPESGMKISPERWFREKAGDFIFEFFQTARESERGLILHRCIRIDKVETFVEQLLSGQKVPRGLGIYWTFNENYAICHGARQSGHDVIVVATVPLGSIDVLQTFLANCQPYLGENEREVTLRSGAPLHLQAIIDPLQHERKAERPLRMTAQKSYFGDR